LFFGKEKAMTLEEAIKTAIEYEIHARDAYRSAVEATMDPRGKRIFHSLAEDEQHHIDYLKAKLMEWRESGKITLEKIKSTIPSKEKIALETKNLQKRAADKDRGDEKQMLSKALKMEIDASRFYRGLVTEMPQAVKPLFEEFLAIEERHIAAVQAELDYISHTGYWFDFKEFDME
jgi:rubrerythrin